MQKTNVAQMRVSEEGQFFMNVYFCSSHAFVKLVPSSHQEVVFYSGLFYDSIIHGTYLWPFPVSSVINTVLKLIVEKEGDEDVVCPQHLCKSDCRCMYRSIPLFLVTEPFSPLYTFFLPDFILPRKVRSHLKVLQCTCDWQNICPGNVLISPQLINTSFSCSLNPQVPLKLWFSQLRIDEEKFEM